MPKKEKKEKESSKAEKQISTLAAIASPLADAKLTRRALKLTKKGKNSVFDQLLEAAAEKSVRKGVKEVTKAIRKGQKGICLLAGDISPIDVITHLPVLCEENEIPYIYVPSRGELGTASATKRPTSCVLIGNNSLCAHIQLLSVLNSKSELQETYQKIESKIKSAH